jgi:hypothetical protein
MIEEAVNAAGDVQQRITTITGQQMALADELGSTRR